MAENSAIDTPAPAPLRLAEIEGRAQAAREMVAALCLPKGMDGARDWVMSVPAQPSRDPDLIIDAALGDIPALVAEVRRLRDALRKIANLPRGDFVLHGPRLPAAIARAALPEETSNG